MKRLSKSSERRGGGRMERSPEALEKRMKKGIIKGASRGFKNVFNPDIKIPLFRDGGKGEHWLDMVSYFAGKNDPITPKGEETHTCEYYYHRDVGPNDDPYICLVEMGLGKKCPVCEDRNALRKAGEDDEIWKALFPKTRNLYNVIVRDGGKEEKKGVQVYDVSFHYMEKYLQALAKKPVRPGRKQIDPFVPFAHPKLGKTLYFEIHPPKGKEDYASYLGHNFEDRDYTISKKEMSNLFTLDELLYIPTYDDVYEAHWFDKGEKGKGRKSKHKKEKEEETDIPDFDEIEEELEDMDRDELLEYIDEEGLPIKVKSKMDEDDIIEKIMDHYASSGKDDDSKGECPASEGEFGEDTNTLDECDDCDEWEECMKALKESRGK